MKQEEFIRLIPTHILVKYLLERTGVTEHKVEPYEDFAINVNGPAVVLVVTD